MRRLSGLVLMSALGALATWTGSDALSPSRPPAADATAAPAGAVRTLTVASTVPDAPTLAVAPAAAWVPATENLEGLPSECGNLSSVVARPDRDMVIAGIALRGLFAQVDGGAWTALGGGGGSATITNRMSSIVFDPEHPETFWESGIYNGGGVYRTDDNGATFVQLGDVVHSDLVSIDWTDPERRTLLSGTHEQPVVYRSADGGATWQDVSGSLPEGIGHASSPLVLDAQTHLLGTNNGPMAGVFRTTDGGTTWTLVRPGGVLGAPLVVDGTISWLMEQGGGVVSSTDGGVTWVESPAGGAIYPYAAHLVGLPGGRLATIGQGNVIVSDDGGATWSPFGPALPYTPNGLTYSPVEAAFYTWRFDCDFTTENPIAVDSIMRLDVDVTA